MPAPEKHDGDPPESKSAALARLTEEDVSDPTADTSGEAWTAVDITEAY